MIKFTVSENMFCAEHVPVFAWPPGWPGAAGTDALSGACRQPLAMLMPGMRSAPSGRSWPSRGRLSLLSTRCSFVCTFEGLASGFDTYAWIVHERLLTMTRTLQHPITQWPDVDAGKYNPGRQPEVMCRHCHRR